MIYKIATRGSRLALRQSGMVQELLKEHGELDTELMVVKTKGDQIRDVPLSQVTGTGFFTKEIEQALLDQIADIAIHSLKDLPIEQPNGLNVTAIVKREDPSEVIITRQENIDDSKPLNLKEGITIGTSAIRRKAQIKAIHPDLIVKELRGNVTTRIEKVRSGEYDAVMIAYAGLKRVGIDLDDLQARVLDTNEFVPAPAQGALAVETRNERSDVYDCVAKINDPATVIAVDAERNLLLLCGGGCHLPLGANVYQDGELWKASIFWAYNLPDGSEVPVHFQHQADIPRKLIDECYAKLKKIELDDLLKFYGREKDNPPKLLITRPSKKTSELSEKLKVNNIELISYPILKLKNCMDSAKWNEISSNLGSYDYMIFTSTNGVDYFKSILDEHNISPYIFANIKIAAIGQKTAEVCRHIFRNNEIMVSSVATGIGLGEYLAGQEQSKNIQALFPCTKKAGNEMELILSNAGWIVDRLEIYQTDSEDSANLPEIDTQDINYICFTSALAVEYTDRQINIPDNMIIISIGPKTSEKLTSMGYRVDWEIPNSNLEWLWRAI
jgi:hydroxymethylbilane synthase